MEEPVMDAVFGNVGTIVSFRVGAEDGEFLEKWFQPDFLMNDIVNLGKRNMYLKLMIDGVSSRGFSAQTIDSIAKLDKSNRESVIDFSRKTYATSREIVEKNIAEWAGMDGEEHKKEGYGGPRSDSRQPRQQYSTFERREPQFNDQRFQQAPNRPPAPIPSQLLRPETRPAQPHFQPSHPQPQRPVEPQPKPAVQPNFEPKPQVQLQSKPQSPPLMPSQPQQRPGLPLSEALKTGPVNFRGRRIEDKREKPKIEVDTDALKKVLEDAMSKKE